MGKIKHLARIEELFEKSPVVGFKSIKRIVGNEGYAKLLIRNLLAKRKIFRIAKGFYTRHNESTLFVFFPKPSYLGLQSALSYHNLWEQETIPIVLTSKNIRQGIRNVLGSNLAVKKLDKKYVFGFEYLLDGDFYVPYSDVEKTLIDMVFFKQNLSNEAVKKIRKCIDKKKLDNYLKKYDKSFRKKVLALLISHSSL